MKAIVVHEVAGQPQLVWEEVADVSLRPDQVLVNVWATAVNRADLSQARGGYPPPAGESPILGLEMAGVISDFGAATAGEWQLGDRVCALLPGGGYAQQVAVHPQLLLPLPADWSFEQGAAIPEVWLTAFVNLCWEGQLQAGQTVLIHAGASGVGTAAIQLAGQLGATVLTTVGTPAKATFCQQLGATAINYHAQDFVEEVLTATAGRGVDLILDPVGASYLPQNIRLLKESGRLIHIGLLGGRKAELDLGLVLGKSLHLIGSRLRPRPLAEKIKLTREFRHHFWPLFTAGRLRPIIDSIFPLPAAQAAHDYVRGNQNIGKVILSLAP